MRIIISLYCDNILTEETTLVYSKFIMTNWDFPQIETHLSLEYPFCSTLFLGHNLSFFDIHRYSNDYESLIKKVNDIPINAQEETRNFLPYALSVEKYDPDSADSLPYPDLDKCFLYNANRYECGASGFSAIVYWASAHPLEMVVIGGIVYDLLKLLLKKVLHLFYKGIQYSSKQPVFLRVSRLYHNFSLRMGLNVQDIQIVKIAQLKRGMFSITIRTISNEKYKVKCSANGTIAFIQAA